MGRRKKTSVARLILLIQIVTLVFTGYCYGIVEAGVVSKVSRQEETRWLHWTIPLPKEVSIEEKAEVTVSDVKIRLRDGASDVERNAAATLRGLFREKTAADVSEGGFEIVLGVCDKRGQIEGLAPPDASRLASLPNREQAYCINSMGTRQLVLTAFDERGVFYAALTLRQLLEGTFRDGKVTIPLATVVDWPDLSERGLWGANASRVVEWLASRKMNIVETMPRLLVQDDGTGVVQFISIDVLAEGVINPPHLNDEVIEAGRLHALNVVPIINHPDYYADNRGYYAEPVRLYEIYPEVRGKGKSARHKGVHKWVPCTAEPNLVKVVAEWMTSIASHKGVTDIDAWLSEYPLYCACAKCSNTPQPVGETRMFLKAWRIARKRYPDLGLRILLTNGTSPHNDKVLAEIPEDVGVYYYHATKTYDSSRRPMIYPLLEAYAAKGRWLGCVPQLTASWVVVCPWSCPQFIKHRMTEFVDKKLSCVLGFATPNTRLYDFNITAAAEWSWNAHGRNEREFAIAWATRKGLNDPEAAAEWAVLLGPVGWDVYGSSVPFDFYKGSKVVQRVFLERRRAPALGKDIFLYYPTLEHFDHNIALSQKALKIAERINSPLLVDETLVIQGYTKLLREIYVITQALSSNGTIDAAGRARLVQSMSALAYACRQTTSALRRWEGAIGEQCGLHGIGGHRFRNTVKATEQTAIAVGQELRRLGIENNIAAYLSGGTRWQIDERVDPVNE